jgi:hypothetical protein
MITDELTTYIRTMVWFLDEQNKLDYNNMQMEFDIRPSESDDDEYDPV